MLRVNMAYCLYLTLKGGIAQYRYFLEYLQARFRFDTFKQLGVHGLLSTKFVSINILGSIM